LKRERENNLASVSFKKITKYFGRDVKAVDQLDLEVKDKEFLVLVGPSGCGKTTALRIVAGLEETSHGDLYIDQTKVNDVPPKDRDIAMVFQNYALYPHMTVYDNIAFGLRIRKLKGFGGNSLILKQQKRSKKRFMRTSQMLHRC